MERLFLSVLICIFEYLRALCNIVAIDTSFQRTKKDGDHDYISLMIFLVGITAASSRPDKFDSRKLAVELLLYKFIDMSRWQHPEWAVWTIRV